MVKTESPSCSTESRIHTNEPDTYPHLLDPATLNTYQPVPQNEAELQPIHLNLPTNQPKDQNRPWIAIMLTIFSGIFFSICSIIVKSMKDVDPLELAICRYIGLLIPSILILIWRKEQLFLKGNRDRLLIALRSLIGVIDIAISFYVYRHMPLGEVAAIVYSMPVYVTFFACIFLKEPCGLFNVITIILTFTGVLLVTKPPFLFGQVSDTADSHTLGTVATFVSTIVAANVYVLLRSLKSVHFSVLLANYAIFALPPIIAVSWYLNVLRLPKSSLEWLSMMAFAFLSFAAHMSNTLALKFGNAGFVATVKSANIALAFIWQIFLFKQLPHFYSVVGAILIIISVVSIGLRDMIFSLLKNSRFKKKLRISPM